MENDTLLNVNNQMTPEQIQERLNEIEQEWQFLQTELIRVQEGVAPLDPNSINDPLIDTTGVGQYQGY